MINYFFAEVIVPIALDKTLTYIVSETEFHFLQNEQQIGIACKYATLVQNLSENKPIIELEKITKRLQ